MRSAEGSNLPLHRGQADTYLLHSVEGDDGGVGQAYSKRREKLCLHEREINSQQKHTSCFAVICTARLCKEFVHKRKKT